ncbi:response regulator transcription factor [Gracilinema caldarium]|uniref:Two component transcriptional regulator, LuxR family n=1 Tax=Gracilinema caldarium (strain ATCC 51460 / DSM 7334 / H1) TaxID=744872 RepID=F8F370_GRAC1|nr:response regulator transcription factor [Gracilinema caldarium]AEJ20396.1 two component transcriptional regulator, LuxR family [Gracilinema caldarium DSM 7334]
MKDKPIRILLADDQYLFLESLKLVLESLAEDLQVAGTVCNGEEALEFLEKQPVDVVLLDVRMPIMDGVQTAGEIHKRWPHIAVIMLTTFEDDEYVAEALQRGAQGYLLKNIAPHMLVSAIRAVRDGSILIAPDLAGHLAMALAGNRNPATGAQLPDWYYNLTPRDKTIITLILKGMTNKEIASTIHLGEQTVRNYISALYDKLHVSDRREAINILRSIDPCWFI